MAGLTPLQVKNAKPGRWADGKGLYLLVKPSGSKSWVLRIQVSGKRRDFGLGSFDTLSLAEAREKAREGRKLAKAGLDPSFEWRRAKRPLPTFKALAEEYHASASRSWKNGKHKDQWLSTLKTYVFPKLGNTRIDQIGVSEIQAVLDPIWIEKAETARRVKQRIGTILNYAHGKGLRETEAPLKALQTLMKGVKQRRPKNFPAMPYAELPAFMDKLQRGEQTEGRKALQFLILTVARSGEVRRAVNAELDLERKRWCIPASRMKMGLEHVVPLSRQAMELAIQAKSEEPNSLLFRGLRGKAMSDMTLSKVLKDNGATGVTVHGFRSSFRDWVAEQTDFPGDWAEAALAHAPSNKVEAAYKRTRFVEQRGRLMQAWADFLLRSRNDQT